MTHPVEEGFDLSIECIIYYFNDGRHTGQSNPCNRVVVLEASMSIRAVGQPADAVLCYRMLDALKLLLLSLSVKKIEG